MYPKLSRVYFRLRKLEKDQIRTVSLRFGDFSLWLMGEKMYSFFFSGVHTSCQWFFEGKRVTKKTSILLCKMFWTSPQPLIFKERVEMSGNLFRIPFYYNIIKKKKEKAFGIINCLSLTDPFLNYTTIKITLQWNVKHVQLVPI